MNYLDIGEIVSTFLTVPTVIGCMVIIALWGPKSVQIIKNGGPQDAAEWFIVGVAVGFLGEALDNLYWNIPWSLSFLEHPDAAWYHKYGVLANIPFRQIAAIIAIYCHAKSYMLHAPNKANFILKAGIPISIVLAIAYTWVLFALR